MANVAALPALDLIGRMDTQKFSHHLKVYHEEAAKSSLDANVTKCVWFCMSTMARGKSSKLKERLSQYTGEFAKATQDDWATCLPAPVVKMMQDILNPKKADAEAAEVPKAAEAPKKKRKKD